MYILSMCPFYLFIIHTTLQLGWPCMHNNQTYFLSNEMNCTELKNKTVGWKGLVHGWCSINTLNICHFIFRHGKALIFSNTRKQLKLIYIFKIILLLHKAETLQWALIYFISLILIIYFVSNSYHVCFLWANFSIWFLLILSPCSSCLLELFLNCSNNAEMRA